jgi:phosphatidylglycerophosphate synthase
MSLTRIIRTRFQSITEPIGRGLANAGVSPNIIAGLGFGFALVGGFLFATKTSELYLAGVAIAFSAVMDLMDGAVARSTPKFSRSLSTWNLNDSTLDRLSEIAIYTGILYANDAPAIVALLSLSFWFLVVYVKAKGDSLGLVMSNRLGIISRAEFLAVLVFFTLAGYVWVGVFINLILSGITFVQRYLYAISTARKKLSPLGFR